MAAEHLTPVKLELGGKDPAIVRADADLERTAAGLVWGAFMNCGQTCASLERVYVARPVADELIARVVAHAAKLRVGYTEDGGGVDMGPLTQEGQLRLVEEHVADAVAKGAQIRTGGARPAGLDPTALPGYFHAPTVLTGVDHGMRCMTEETFGPTLPIMVVDSDEEAVALANDSPFGLTASVWTRDRARALEIAGRLRAGTVTVNDHNFTHGVPEAPWSGVGESGFGASHGEDGLFELTHPKHVSEDRLPLARNLWWFPYDGKLEVLLNGALSLAGAADTARRFFTGSKRPR